MKPVQITQSKARPGVLTLERSWRDLRLIVVGAVLCAGAASVISCTAVVRNQSAEAAELATLPVEVRKALDRASQVYAQPLVGAKWSRVHALSESNHAVYQLQGTNDRGNKIELEVTSAGRIIEVEEHGIAFSEVPDAVSAALKSKLPQFEPTQVEAIYQGEKTQPVAYGFEGRDAGGKWIEVYLSADGKSVLN